MHVAVCTVSRYQLVNSAPLANESNVKTLHNPVSVSKTDGVMWLSLTADKLRVADVPEVLTLGGAADGMVSQELGKSNF